MFVEAVYNSLRRVNVETTAVMARVLRHDRAARRQALPAQTPKAAAPIDLTGYWVSIVTEDWRYRMVTPTEGRLSRRADDAGSGEGGGGLESRGRYCSGEPVQELRRARDHAGAGQAAYDVGRRQDAEARSRRRHADAHVPISKSRGEARAELAGRLLGGVGHAAPRARCAAPMRPEARMRSRSSRRT